MRERIIIVFIAIAIGLLVTTLIFYLYQQTKTVPEETKIISKVEKSVSSAPQSNILLTVDTPLDESLSETRSVQVKGKTNPENTVIITTNQEDEIVNPSNDGAYSATVTISAGGNKIVVRSITPNGEETSLSRIVTFSTEEF